MKILNLFRTADYRFFSTESAGHLPDEVKVWFEWNTEEADPTPRREVVIRPAMVLCPEIARRFRRRLEGTKGLGEVKVIDPTEGRWDVIDAFDEVLGPPRPPTQEWPRKEANP